MPEINDDLQFEEHIAGLEDRKLLEFVARQQYDMSKVCPIHAKDIKMLKSRSKKSLGLAGAGGAGIGTALAALVDYITHRGAG